MKASKYFTLTCLLVLSQKTQAAHLWAYLTGNENDNNSDTDTDYYSDNDAHESGGLVSDVAEFALKSAGNFIGNMFYGNTENSKGEDKLPEAKPVYQQNQDDNQVITAENVQYFDAPLEVHLDNSQLDENVPYLITTAENGNDNYSAFDSQTKVITDLNNRNDELFNTEVTAVCEGNITSELIQTPVAVKNIPNPKSVKKLNTKKSDSIDYEKVRERLRESLKDVSDDRQKILNILDKSHMGNIDFTSENGSNDSKSIAMAYKNNLKGKPGFRLLTAKDSAGLDVLKGWLINGLMLAYPTLLDDVTKDDAIALILLAILSKSFMDPVNNNTIKLIIKDLAIYNGNKGTFPMEQFEIDNIADREETRKNLIDILIEIIKDKKLPYASKAINKIL